MKANNLQEMANRIKNRRKELGFTQESFCETAELSISSYTKIENAFQSPSLDALVSIAHHLNLSLDYIVFGKWEHQPKEVAYSDILNILVGSADEEELLRVGELLMKIAKAKKKYI